MAGTGIYGQILRAQLENAAADLTPTAIGLLYYNTTSNIVKWYTGAAWKTAVDTDSSQAVSGKTFTSCTLSGASNTLSNISLSSQVTGTLPIANGGTGQTTANSALNALLPSQATHSGKALTTNGTDTSWASVVTDPTAARGEIIRRGAAVLEALQAKTDNRVVRGDGTDVISGQIDDPDFFTTGAAASASAIGIVTTASQTFAGQKIFSGGYYGNTPLVYTLTEKNPSGTGDVTTDFTAGATSVANSDISVSGPSSGVVTFTFGRTGYFLVTENYHHRHSNTYTISRFQPVRGGTATRYGNLRDTFDILVGVDAQDSDEMGSSSYIVYVSSASQTLTWRPKFNSNGIGNTAEHTFGAAMHITPL